METLNHALQGLRLSHDCTLSQVIHAGYKIIKLGEVDPTGEKAREFIESEGVMLDHNNSGAMMWPVRPISNDPEAARSLRFSAFPLHTDCAFENPSPRFIALYVVRPDKLGGGVSQFLDMRPVIKTLSEGSKEVLQNTLVCWRTPREFNKGNEYIAAPLISKNGGIRYRRDIIVEELLSKEQALAISEIDKLIQRSKNIYSINAASGSLIIVDNWHVLHGRTEILDNHRHLIRIRFNPKSQLT